LDGLAVITGTISKIKSQSENFVIAQFIYLLYFSVNSFNFEKTFIAWHKKLRGSHLILKRQEK